MSKQWRAGRRKRTLPALPLLSLRSEPVYKPGSVLLLGVVSGNLGPKTPFD